MLRSIHRIEIKKHKSKSSEAPQTKKTKSKQRRFSRKSEVAAARSASPSDSSSDGCMSLSAEEIPATPPVLQVIYQDTLTLSIDTFEAQGTNPMYHDHHKQHPDAPSSFLIDLSTIEMYPFAKPLQADSTQSHSDDDILFVLSGIFDSGESSNDDDLASILSLDEASEDFMHPFGF